MKMWPSVGPVIRGRGLPLVGSHTVASLPHTLLAARKAKGLGHSVGLWHWARLTGPHGDQACSPDLSGRKPALTKPVPHLRRPLGSRPVCVKQTQGASGSSIPCWRNLTALPAHGALLLFPFPLVSPIFRNGMIHRLLLGLFSFLGEIKDHQSLGALLTATENFQSWLLCPFWTLSQQASSSDSRIPYCVAGQKKGFRLVSDWPLSCASGWQEGWAKIWLIRSMNWLMGLAFFSLLISICTSQSHCQGQRAFSQGSLLVFPRGQLEVLTKTLAPPPWWWSAFGLL